VFVDVADREVLVVPTLPARNEAAVVVRFVGEGPLANELKERVAELGLGARVRFDGQVPNDELPKTYAESAVFALPSDVEGFPRTVLEAMACGTPVVTSDLPQLQSVVERVGATVPTDDVEGLASALQRLLNDDTCRDRLGQKAREYVVEHHSWRDTVEQTTQVYHDLVSASDRSPRDGGISQGSTDPESADTGSD
jgi:glycosyltransferase involved in cell wall biosynthesis